LLVLFSLCLSVSLCSGNKIENVSVTPTQLPSRINSPPPVSAASVLAAQINIASPQSNPQRYSTTPFSPPPPPNTVTPTARAPVTREQSGALPPPQTVKFGSTTTIPSTSTATTSTIPVAPPLAPPAGGGSGGAGMSSSSTNYGALVRQSTLEKAVADSTDRGEEVKRQQTLERQMLEKDLQEKMRIQQEGRKREAIARERAMSRQRVDAARALESKNPMTLAGEVSDRWVSHGLW
jgi:hypothetical protein